MLLDSFWKLILLIQHLIALLFFQVEQSLLVTGFGYEHDDAWAANIQLFKEYTDISRVPFSVPPPTPPT